MQASVGAGNSTTSTLIRQLSTKEGLSFNNPLFSSVKGKKKEGEALPTSYVEFDGVIIAAADIPGWLRGRMTREQAEQALGGDASLVGDFLVRESPSDGCHCITVKAGTGAFEHHKVKRIAVGQPYLLNGKPLTVTCISLLDVVRHLSKNREQTTVLLNFSDADSAAAENMYGAMQREEERFYGQLGAKPQVCRGHLKLVVVVIVISNHRRCSSVVC